MFFDIFIFGVVDLCLILVDCLVMFLVRGFGKVYGSGEVVVWVLCGVDMDLFEGEFVVLIGQLGSGKLILFNIIGGFDYLS